MASRLLRSLYLDTLASRRFPSPVIFLALFAASALAVIWCGYPLAVRALGGLQRRRRFPSPLSHPRVSVILATCDDAVAIRARVSDLLATSYPAALVEVIVAVDVMCASSVLPALVGLDARVTVVTGDMPGGKATTLNAAVRVARHDLLIFADTAQRFARDAIPELVMALGDPALGAVSGMLELRNAGTSLNLAERYWRYERWLRAWEARLHSSVGVTGAIYAMRRELWSPLPAGLILDDVYVPMRLVLDGWRVGYAELARAHDPRRFTAAEEYHRKVRTLTGNIQLCAWLPAVLNPFENPILLQFVFHKLMRLLTPYLAVLALVGGVIVFVDFFVAGPTGWRDLLLACGAVGIGLCLMPRLRRALRAQLAWGVALQSSVVVATANGMRGQWDVWQ